MVIVIKDLLKKLWKDKTREWEKSIEHEGCTRRPFRVLCKRDEIGTWWALLSFHKNFQPEMVISDAGNRLKY